MFYERKRYTLDYKTNRLENATEPTNWEDVSRKKSRNRIYHGIDTNISEAIIFTGDERAFLIDMADTYGVNALVRIKVEVKSAQTDLWEIDYIGFFDFTTYKITEFTFECKVNADSLKARLKSKKSVKVELARPTTLTDKGVDFPLATSDLWIEGREILQNGRLASNDDTVTKLAIQTGDGGAAVVSPLWVDEVSNDADGPLYMNPQFADYTDEFGRTDVTVRKLEETFILENLSGEAITYKVNINHRCSLFATGVNSGNLVFKIRIAIYSGTVQTETKDLYVYEGTLYDFPYKIEISTGDFDLLILQNQSASLQYFSEDLTGSGYLVTHHYLLSAWSYYADDVVYYYYNQETEEWLPSFAETSIVVNENTIKQETVSKMVTLYEAAKRLMKITLDADFYSDLLGLKLSGYEVDGAFANTALVHGGWLRGMTEAVNTFKPISTSIQDLFQSIDALYPIGLSADRNTIRIEDRRFFYDKRVTIQLEDITDLELSVDVKDYNSTIEVDYATAGSYNDLQGLDEYNRKTQYNLPIIATDTELKIKCKYNTAGYALEMQRRENPIIDSSKNFEDDAPADDKIWILDVDLPDGSTNWRISRWEKRFAKPPNCYSPDTAMNLWFSPINVLLRHGRWIKNSLLKNKDGLVSFLSSDGNSDLKTQLIDGKEYTQGVGIPIVDLDRADNAGKLATFKAPVTYAQLEGETNGKKNIYGMVEFYYKNIKYGGHILDVDIENGIGDFKIKLQN